MAYVSGPKSSAEEPFSPNWDSRPGGRDPQEVQLEQLKNHLADLRGKYTAKHPDILTTQKKIAELEATLEKGRSEKEAGERKAPGQNPPSPQREQARRRKWITGLASVTGKSRVSWLLLSWRSID